jgi:hypothetical protein
MFIVYLMILLQVSTNNGQDAGNKVGMKGRE